MKHIFNRVVKVFFIMAAVSLMSQQVNAKDIVVYIDNIATEKPGNIMVMLYGYDGFPKDHAKAISVEVRLAVIDKMTITFSSVPAEFAIKVLHDEDETGQVTKNWTGIIPAEGLGFSNGAKLSFGPPNFDRAKVKLADINSPISIKIIYP
ncbi:DUF2141 domain-containing protein [Colwellia sp. TT2012]|uniref:DUF2141 domain-containing protein n=1 Tax=Colwellia sp. TT2012 TaxID=1720342 RepID=UPI00070B518C|nr:DUF2141 domain-containing protein [Colwellia sp. TT2012]